MLVRLKLGEVALGIGMLHTGSFCGNRAWWVNFACTVLYHMAEWLWLYSKCRFKGVSWRPLQNIQLRTAARYPKVLNVQGLDEPMLHRLLTPQWKRKASGLWSSRSSGTSCYHKMNWGIFSPFHYQSAEVVKSLTRTSILKSLECKLQGQYTGLKWE